MTPSPPTHIPTYSDTSRPTFRPSISPSSSYPTSSQPTIFPTQQQESNFPTNSFLQESEFPTLQPSISPSNNIDTKQQEKEKEKEVSQNIPSSFPTLAQYTIYIYNNDDENNSPTIEPEMFNIMPISLKFTESNSLIPTQQDDDETQFPFVQIVPVILVALLFFIFFKYRPKGVVPEDDVIHEDEI